MNAKKIATTIFLKTLLFSGLMLLLTQLAQAQCSFNTVQASSDTIRHCRDGNPMIVNFTSSQGADNTYSYALTDENEIIDSQIFSGQIDISLKDPGEYHVYGIDYAVPPLTVPTGQPITSVTSSGCTFISDNFIVIYVDDPVNIADAGPDLNICGTTSLFLDGNTAVNGSGLWDQYCGPVKAYLTDPTNPNTEADGFIAGTYCFTWTISNEGCPISIDSFTLTYSTPFSSNAGPDQFLCSASETTLQGNNPITLTGEWSNISGPTQGVFADANDRNTQVSNLVTGDYEFEWQITSGACITQDTVLVRIVADPTANAGIDMQVCEVPSYTLDGNTPSVGTGMWANVSGPANATFVDATNPTTAVEGLKEGIYEFEWTITNDYCISKDTVSLEFYDKPELAAISTDVSVFGASDGSIEVCAITGTAPFTVSYTPDNVGSLNMLAPNACLERYEIADLPGGFYDIFVEDANGCQDTILNQEVEEIDCSGFSITSISPTDETCNEANDGEISIAVTGGFGDLVFDIGNGVPAVTSSASTYVFTNLEAGLYSIISVTDAKGCQIYSPITITINEPPELLLSGTGTDESTVGASDGAILVCANGGDPSYSVSISPPAGTLFNQGPVSCAANFQYINLPPDIYTVTLTDQNGCMKEIDVAIGSPSCAIAVGQVFVNESPACNGDETGELIVTASGSNNYRFSIDGGLTFTALTNSSFQSFNGLPAGEYNIVVNDGDFCQASFSGNPVVLTEPAAIEGVASTTAVTAVGANDGSIDLCISGGTPFYTVTYLSNSGATGSFNNLGAGPCEGNFGLTNLSADTFDIFIQDMNACTDTLWGVIVLPAICSQFSLDMPTITPVSCVGSSDGQVQAVISSGQSPYLYILDDGVNADSSSTTLNTDYTFFDLVAGNYTLWVIDGNGCTLTENVVVTSPDPIAASITVIDPTIIGVNNGEICINPAGGDGNYTVTATCGAVLLGAGLACTGDFHISNVPPGDCIITITDGLGCSYEETVNVIDPACATFALLSVVPNQVSCFGDTDGTITIAVSGGNAPYEFSIDGGFTFASSSNSTFTFPNLEPDDYNVIVKDGNDCSFSFDTNPVTVEEPQPLGIAFDPFPSCIDGSTGRITAEIVGGNAPFTYLWSNGETTATISNLAPDTYSLSITDQNACFKSGAVLLPELQPVVVNAGEPINILAGDPAQLEVLTNALPPYDVIWSPADDLDDPTSETPLASPLQTVNYEVVVTSREGCIGTDEVLVTVTPRGILNIPTGFSPNGDNKNDVFDPIVVGSTVLMSFRVFNRWGELIHNDINAWDGRYNGEEQPVGTYIYVIDYLDEAGKDNKVSGHVSLLR